LAKVKPALMKVVWLYCVHTVVCQKAKPLIKFLSEGSNRSLLQKTENYYMQDQGKEMPLVDADLFFIIDEKNNSVELTEKGIELITASGEDPQFLCNA
jgi:preprotein translocase subunit SecA